MSEPFIKVSHLKKYFDAGKGKCVKALDDVSLEVYPGEILGVVGESGCGKSTLGRCIMRLADITDGQIIMDGKDISKLTKQESRELRRKSQMVFQNPYSSFNPKHTIGRSLFEVAELFGMSKEEARQDIYERLKLISLDQSVLDRRPGELSGGQLQRLAIARALITKPVFILADEPVSALDVSVQAQILNLIFDLRQKFNQTMMFISHDLPVVEHICDRIVVMYLGTIMEMGSTDDIFSATSHPYTKALIASKPRSTPDAPIPKVELKGDLPNAMEMPDGCRFHTRCPYCIPGKCDAAAPLLKEISPGHFCACYRREEMTKENNELSTAGTPDGHI